MGGRRCQTSVCVQAAGALNITNLRFVLGEPSVLNITNLRFSTPPYISCIPYAL